MFETFGPVVEPFYLVRMNRDHLQELLSVAPDTEVFYAPHSTRYTKYVFVDHLRT